MSSNVEHVSLLGAAASVRDEPAAVAPGDERPDFARELLVYVGRARDFTREDWVVYVLWVGMMFGLLAVTGGFLLFGHTRGVRFPAEAWMVPIGTALFALSIAVDTIGHRTIYKREIQRAEGLVHAITIFAGVGSCVLLSMAYTHRAALWIPAMVLTVLSVVYSLVDEAFHWRRYVSAKADRVEMWSHVGILLGHGVMMTGWWVWFAGGYAGVGATLRALAG